MSCNGSSFSTGGTTSGSVSVSPSIPSAYAVTCQSAAGLTYTYNLDVPVAPPNGEIFGEPFFVVPGNQGASLSNLDSGNQGLLLAQKAHLAAGGELQTLSFYVVNAPAGSQVALAVYDDTGGNPGILLAFTNPIPVSANSWNTASVTLPTTLSSGDYWLAWEMRDNGQGMTFVKQQPGTLNETNFVFNTWSSFGSFPSNFPTAGESAGAVVWSFYGTLHP